MNSGHLFRQLYLISTSQRFLLGPGNSLSSCRQVRPSTAGLFYSLSVSRFQIAGGDKFPNLALSPQAIINCRAGGSCEGGNPAGVYEFAANFGVPDVTCLVYEAVDGGPVEDCSKPDINLCRDCTWPPPNPGDKPNCWAKKEFPR